MAQKERLRQLQQQWPKHQPVSQRRQQDVYLPTLTLRQQLCAKMNGETYHSDKQYCWDVSVQVSHKALAYI